MPLALKRYFTMATPMSVPSTVAMRVTTNATFRLNTMASRSSGYLNGSVHASSENWFQM